MERILTADLVSKFKEHNAGLYCYARNYRDGVEA